MLQLHRRHTGKPLELPDKMRFIVVVMVKFFMCEYPGRIGQQGLVVKINPGYTAEILWTDAQHFIKLPVQPPAAVSRLLLQFFYGDRPPRFLYFLDAVFKYLVAAFLDEKIEKVLL